MTDSERLDFIIKLGVKVNGEASDYWAEYTDINGKWQCQISSYLTPRKAIDALYKSLNK